MFRGIVLALLISGVAHAAETFQEAQFDVNQKSLPPDYRGVGFNALLEALDKLREKIGTRGEFETTEAFNARKADALKLPLLGDLTTKSVFAFVVPIQPDFTRYDIDKKLFDFQHRRTKGLVASQHDLFSAQLSLPFTPNIHKRALITAAVESEKSQYTATTAMNVQVTVTRERSDYLGIAYCATPDIIADCARLPASFKVSLEPDAARAAKTASALLLIGTLAEPFVLNYSQATQPTIKAPFESTTTIKAVNLDASALWVFNTKTGEVYLKTSLTAPPASTPASTSAAAPTGTVKSRAATSKPSDTASTEPPKKKEDDFFSMMERSIPTPSPPPSPSKPAARQTAPPSPTSAQQKDALRRTISPCWAIDPGQLTSMQIELKLTMNPDGSVQRAEVQDNGRYASDQRYRAAADAARRAVLNPRCNPLPLPRDKYAQWQTTYLTFDPKDF